MTADQLHHFMQNPDKLNQATLSLLKELTERYPAFETGWLLYLKNLKILNHTSFEQELVYGAIRIHDRRKLYLFLNEKKNIAELEILVPDEESVEDLDKFNLYYPADYRFNDEKNKEDKVIADVPENTEKKFSLIDKFLEAQPKMPPVKESDSGSANDSQKQNTDESDDLITETLAAIYAQQGYYKKALQIFEKLSLKYPEKSSYFAGHIEKIKNLMNN